jgi:hypothetical protein
LRLACGTYQQDRQQRGGADADPIYGDPAERDPAEADPAQAPRWWRELPYIVCPITGARLPIDRCTAYQPTPRSTSPNQSCH